MGPLTRRHAAALWVALALPLAAAAPGCGSDKRTGRTGDASDTTSGADVAAGSGVLLLNELMSYAPDRALSYVELYNPGPEAVALGAFTLVRYPPGETVGRTVALPDEVLAAGATWTVGTTLAANGAYLAELGRAVDQTSEEVTGGGEDAWALERGGELLDLYGVVGAASAEGDAFRMADAIAVRFPGSAPTATWRPLEWMIVADVAAETFGEPNWAPARWDLSTFGEVRFAP